MNTILKINVTCKSAQYKKYYQQYEVLFELFCYSHRRIP